MESHSPANYVISLNPGPERKSSQLEKIHLCELDIDAILARIDDMYPVFQRFQEEDAVRENREWQAKIISYFLLAFSLASFISWIVSMSLSDPDAKNIAGKFQAAFLLATLISFGGYLWRKTPPDGWPIKLQTLACRLSRDEIHPLEEIVTALVSLREHLLEAYPGNNKIIQLINSNLIGITELLDDRSKISALTIHIASKQFEQTILVTEAAQALFQGTQGYEARKTPGYTLKLFGREALQQTQTSGSEFAPLLLRR